MSLSPTELRIALLGWQAVQALIQAQIDEVQRQLKKYPAGNGATRTLSQAARARIAAAQRKRWAVTADIEAGRKPVQVATKAAARPAVQPVKRKLTPEGRRRIVEATKKRWKAYRAQQAQQQVKVMKAASV